MLKSGCLGAHRPLTAQSERTWWPIFPDISHVSAFFQPPALLLIDFPLAWLFSRLSLLNFSYSQLALALQYVSIKTLREANKQSSWDTRVCVCVEGAWQVGTHGVNLRDNGVPTWRCWWRCKSVWDLGGQRQWWKQEKREQCEDHPSLMNPKCLRGSYTEVFFLSWREIRDLNRSKSKWKLFGLVLNFRRLMVCVSLCESQIIAWRVRITHEQH